MSSAPSTAPLGRYGVRDRVFFRGDDDDGFVHEGAGRILPHLFGDPLGAGLAMVR